MNPKPSTLSRGFSYCRNTDEVNRWLFFFYISIDLIVTVFGSVLYIVHQRLQGFMLHINIFTANYFTGITVSFAPPQCSSSYKLFKQSF